MGCNQSKPEDVEGNAQVSDRSGRFGLDPQLSTKIVQGAKNVVHDTVNVINDKALKPVGMMAEKVAALAIAVPQSLGHNITRQAHHLKNVFVPPIAADDLKGFTLPVYPKSEEERKFILKVLSESFIFAGLQDRELKSIVDAFEKKSFEGGAEILQQGDETADFFYILYDGDVT